MNKRLRSKSGFTLIELIIVLVLIGILAAVAVPRFANLQDGAEDAAVRGTLGNVRSALYITRAENMANFPSDTTTGGTGTVNWWPTLAQLQTAGSVIDGPMPTMPKGATPAATIAADATGSATVRTVSGVTGWKYNPNNGTFWANTAEDVANTW